MKPIDFPQSTKVLQRPSTMTEQECQSLHVWNDGKQCVSCWKLSFKERMKVLFNGKVWLGVLSGKTQPPVFLSGECVFEKAPIKERLRAFFAEAKESVIEAFESVIEGTKQPDKRKHFIVGALIAFIVGVLIAPWVGFIAGCLAAILKEWWDSKGHGTVEVMDALFTVVGAAFGALFAILVIWLFHAMFPMLWQR